MKLTDEIISFFPYSVLAQRIPALVKAARKLIRDCLFKSGRIDPDELIYFVVMGHQTKDLAARYSLPPRDFETHFAPILAEGRMLLKDEILKKQLMLALSGDGKMLIHLGKAVCEQHDRTHLEVSNGYSDQDRVFERIRPPMPPKEADVPAKEPPKTDG